MWHYIVGGTALWLLGPHLFPGMGQPQAQPQPPDPMQALCPVDAHMPPDLKAMVRGCWTTGTIETCRDFANTLGMEFPIASMTLNARALKLMDAKTAQANQPAKPASSAVVSGPALSPEEQAKKTRLEENLAAIKMAEEANGRVVSGALDNPPNGKIHPHAEAPKPVEPKKDANP